MLKIYSNNNCILLIFLAFISFINFSYLFKKNNLHFYLILYIFYKIFSPIKYHFLTTKDTQDNKGFKNFKYM